MMAKRRRKKKSDVEEHTYIAIRLDGYEVSADASVNMNLRTFPPLFVDEDDPVLEYVTSLEITGISTYPDERAGEVYKITIRGDEKYVSEKLLSLKDMQARDESRIPIYKAYRGEDYPVYNKFPGITTLNKRRGEKLWDAWVRLSPRLVSDMLVILSGDRPLYMSIHERKANRKRWIESISLQTTNPEDE